MRRRQLLLGLAATALARPGLAQERQPRIVILHSGFPQLTPLHLLVDHLRGLGYEQGRSAAIEILGAEGDPARLAQMVDRVRTDPPEVTVAVTSPAARAFKAAGFAGPVVFLFVVDPVGFGLVRSLRQPGGNFTGVSNGDLLLGEKRIELLIDTLPGLRRIAILSGAGALDSAISLDAMRNAAAARGLETVLQDYAATGDFAAAFAGAKAAGAQAVVFLADNLAFGHRKEVAALALANRLPSVHTFQLEVEDGALMAYGVDLDEVYRRTAVLIDKILRGARPADIPVEEPTRFILTVNQRTAAALGLTLPPAVLVRADKVIE